MKRRDFFKIVTGFVAGIFTTSVKSKEDFPIPTDPLKDKFVLNHILTSAENSVGPNWNALGCKDCFRECGQFDDCKAEIKKKVAEETNRLIDPTREYFKMVNKELPPLLQKNIDDTIIKVFA